MNGVCAHVGSTGQEESSEDGEMNAITLPSRHRIGNSSPDALRPSMLPLGHGGSPRYFLYFFVFAECLDIILNSFENVYYPYSPLACGQLVIYCEMMITFPENGTYRLGASVRKDA